MGDLTVQLKHFVPSGHLRRVLDMLQPLLWADHDFRLVVDLTELTFISPTCLAAVAAAIAKARRSQHFQAPGVMHRPKAGNAERFLERVDFYTLLDVKVEEHFARQPTDARFRELVQVGNEEQGNVVSDQIAGVLTGTERGLKLDADAGDVLRTMLWWGLVELMNNVFNHAHSPFGAIACALPFTKSNAIEACVVDCGVGVRASLATLGAYRDISTDEALRTAIEKGVTSQPGDHTGEGLFWLRRIVEENSGKMTVVSEDRALSLTRKGLRVSPVPRWPGTLVSLRFDCRSPIEIQRLFGPPTAEQLGLQLEDLFVE